MNHYWRDASHRLTFSLFDFPVHGYPAVCRAVAAEFALVAEGPPRAAKGASAQDYRADGAVVAVAWDHWSGLTVAAKDGQAEPVVGRIGEWLLSSDWAAAGGDA